MATSSPSGLYLLKWNIRKKGSRGETQDVFVFWHLHSLRQRRELRGDVGPQQPPERGHPAQLHQHLQRGQLLFRGPGRPRPVQRRPRRGPTKTEHRGEPASEGRRPVPALRELIVPERARAPTLEHCCPSTISHRQRTGILSSGSDRAGFNLFSIASFCVLFNFFLYFIGNAFKDAMFSLESMKTKEQAL